jgi:hypothetical protein
VKPVARIAAPAQDRRPIMNKLRRNVTAQRSHEREAPPRFKRKKSLEFALAGDKPLASSLANIILLSAVERLKTSAAIDYWRHLS